MQIYYHFSRLPALDAFPRQIWSRMAARSARHYQYGGSRLPLFIWSSSTQDRARTIPTTIFHAVYSANPRKFLLTSGYVNSINWITNVLLKKHAHIGVEDLAIHSPDTY